MEREMFEHMTGINQLARAILDLRELARVIDQNKGRETSTVDVPKAAQKIVAAADVQTCAPGIRLSEEVNDLPDTDFDSMAGKAFVSARFRNTRGLLWICAHLTD